MGIEKFKDEAEEMKIPKKNFKNKVNDIVEKTIVETKANLPKGFDIETMAEQNDEMNKDKGKKKGSNKGNKSKSKGKSK